MKYLTLTILMALFLCLGCSDSSGPTDDNDNEDPETPVPTSSGSIDSHGGSLVKDSLTLDIPEGSFTNTFDIELKKADETAFETSDQTTATYIIEGIPLSFNEPLEVRISLESGASEVVMLALGETVWVNSSQEVREVYRFIESEIKDGQLVGVIPPISTELTLGKMAVGDEDETFSLKVQAVSGYSPVTSSGSHFRIDYPSSSVSQASAQRLAGYLEDAYAEFKSMGFDYSARTNWSVSVTVKDLGGEKYGEYCSSMWGHNDGYLEFNSRFMDDDAELRITTGHEFFHLVQAFYDPRNSYSRAKLEAPQLWLEEACAVWSEELFTDQGDYVSPVRAGNTLAPYSGIQPTGDTNKAYYGYGLSAIIKYLTEKYGQSSVVGMFENIRNGSDPVTSVILATAEPIEWWEPFLRKYTLSGLYPMTLGELTANKTGMFRVQSASDTIYTHTSDYRDLSGQFYILRLEDEENLKGASMECSIKGNMGELSVFRYNFARSEIIFLGTDTEKVVVNGLGTMANDDSHILVLVSNPRSISPFTGTSSIKFTARIIPPESPAMVLDRFGVSLSRVGGKGFNSNGDSVEISDLLKFAYQYNGTLEGNTFTASIDSLSGAYYTVGDFSYTFDPLFETITEFNVSVYTEYDGNKVTLKIKGGGVPYTSTYQSWRQYVVNNTDIETVLTSFYYRYDSRSGGWYELDTVVPNSSSKLTMSFMKE
ncbi:MAG: hypothetical protein JXB48_15265 [Candidatus Latescibacteria bacterium]|nr:hypothetical protein [Candidatus Latescibacterota bacterium]